MPGNITRLMLNRSIKNPSNKLLIPVNKWTIMRRVEMSPREISRSAANDFSRTDIANPLIAAGETIILEKHTPMISHFLCIAPRFLAGS
jgi:hypothetical protein